MIQKFFKKYYLSILSIFFIFLFIICSIFSIITINEKIIINLSLFFLIIGYISLFLSIIFLLLIALLKTNNKEKKLASDFFPKIGFAFFVATLFDFYVNQNYNLRVFSLMILGFLFILFGYIIKNKIKDK